MINTILLCSTWLLCVVSLERYLSVCHPIRARYVWCLRRSTRGQVRSQYLSWFDQGGICRRLGVTVLNSISVFSRPGCVFSCCSIGDFLFITRQMNALACFPRVWEPNPQFTPGALAHTHDVTHAVYVGQNLRFSVHCVLSGRAPRTLIQTRCVMSCMSA